jgi:hypothetical protein
MRSIATAALLFALGGWPASAAFAQQADVPSAAPSQMKASAVHELVLVDGSRLYGVVEKDADGEVVFRTHSGTLMTVPRSQVRSLRRVEGTMQKGEFMPADPNGTRLFYGPTARSLRKGEVYLGVYELMMPVVQVGVTDRLSIGGGTPLVFGIDDWERPFWITPKFQVFNTGNTQAAVGVLHAFDTDGEGGGVAYGVMTRGNTLGSVTGGAGMAYATAGGRTWVVMVGGERTMHRHIRFVTENHFWGGADAGRGVLSAGVRFFGEKLAADLAVIVPLVEDTFAFPMLNFVYVF